MKKVYMSVLLIISLVLASCGHSDKVAVTFVGQSMEPTIQDEDRLIADEAYYDEHEIERGDLVIAEMEPNKSHVKRVVGLQGERVQMENGQLLVDGEAIDDEFIFQEITYDGLDLTLGDNEYFLLGDALDMSRDSRHIGPIKKEAIHGKIIKIKSKDI